MALLILHTWPYWFYIPKSIREYSWPLYSPSKGHFSPLVIGVRFLKTVMKNRQSFIGQRSQVDCRQRLNTGGALEEERHNGGLVPEWAGGKMMLCVCTPLLDIQYVWVALGLLNWYSTSLPFIQQGDLCVPSLISSSVLYFLLKTGNPILYNNLLQ